MSQLDLFTDTDGAVDDSINNTGKFTYSVIDNELIVVTRNPRKTYRLRPRGVRYRKNEFLKNWMYYAVHQDKPNIVTRFFMQFMTRDELIDEYETLAARTAEHEGTS